MKVQLEQNMMSTPWSTHDIPNVNSLGEAAHQAVLSVMPDLTTEDYTYKIEMDIPLEWGGKTLHYNSIKFYRTEKSEKEYPYRGPAWAEMDYWFAYTFRASPENNEENDND